MSSNKRRTRSSSSEPVLSKENKKKQRLNTSDNTTEQRSSPPAHMLPRPFSHFFPSLAATTSPVNKMASDVLASPERDIHRLAEKLAGEDSSLLHTSPVTPAREMYSRSPSSHVSGSDVSTTSDFQSLRNQMQWLTELVTKQQYAMSMRDALSKPDSNDSAVATAVVENSAGLPTNSTNDNGAALAVVDHTAAVATDVGTNASVDKSAAVAAEEDRVDQCYKGIAVLDAYHKEVPVSRISQSL
jgi:hypothetical protein